MSESVSSSVSVSLPRTESVSSPFSSAESAVSPDSELTGQVSASLSESAASTVSLSVSGLKKGISSSSPTVPDSPPESAAGSVLPVSARDSLASG